MVGRRDGPGPAGPGPAAPGRGDGVVGAGPGERRYKVISFHSSSAFARLAVSDATNHIQQMRQNMISIGDDFWIEVRIRKPLRQVGSWLTFQTQNSVGRRVFKIDGKAVRVLNKLIMEDTRGIELLQMQGKVLSVRNAMDIERPQGKGQVLATVKKDLINVIHDQYNVNVPGKSELISRNS